MIDKRTTITDCNDSEDVLVVSANDVFGGGIVAAFSELIITPTDGGALVLLKTDVNGDGSQFVNTKVAFWEGVSATGFDMSRLQLTP